MKSNGKFLGALVLACGFVFSAWSQDAGTAKNLLKDWSIYGDKDAKITVIQPDGTIACENKTEKDISGVTQGVILDQKEAKTISFSAESKAENVSGDLDAANYAIYMDITYNDDSKRYGVTAPFKTGTHDWEKVTSTFTPEKPIKSLSFYMLFRNKTGKVWFRNAMLTEVAAKK